MSFTSKLSPLTNSVLHAVVALVVYVVPLYLMQHSQTGDLTVSTIVLAGLKYLDEHFGK